MAAVLFLAAVVPACGTAAAAATASDAFADAAGAAAEAETAVPEITVTASRTGAAIETLPVAVTVLDSDTLENQFQRSTDLLRALDFTVPGLNLSTGGRSQCQTRIRGRVPQFQLNGVPANQELRPSNCNSAFQISAFAIERVEVVRGATSLFGAGAPGGIVNLITRRARAERLEIDGVAQTGFNTSHPGGSFQTDLYAGAGQRRGDFDYYFGIGYQDYGIGRDPDGNRVPGTEFSALSLNASLGLALSSGVRLRLMGTWYDENPGQEFNLDGADVAAGAALPRVIAVAPNPFRDQTDDQLGTLALQLEVDDVIGHRLFATAFGQWQRFRQRANFQDFNNGDPDFFSDDRENSTLGTRLTLARGFDIGATRLDVEYGIDWRRDRLIRLQLDVDDPATPIGFIAPEIILYQTGLFTQANWKIGRVRLSAGLRQEFYRGEIGRDFADRGLPGTGTPGRLKAADQLLLNAGIVYEASDTVQLYGSYTEGAELTQLGRAARRATNPGIISPEPAKSQQYELGVRGSLGPVRFSAAGFFSYSASASLVQPDPSCTGQGFCPLIPLRTPQKVWGAEATADWRINDRIDLDALFTWQRGEIFEQSVGGYIPFATDIVSPTRIAVRGSWWPTDRLSFGVQASYSATADFFAPSQLALGRINTPSLFIADASLGWRVGPGEINVAAANIFDRRYQNITATAAGFLSTLAEGRRLTIGYRLRIR